MKKRNLFKLKGLACLVLAGILLVGSLLVPTVKYNVTDINGLENNGSYSRAIEELIKIEQEKGTSNEEIAKKYGKYLEAAKKDYMVLEKTTSASLYNEARETYINWQKSGTVGDKVEDLEPASQIKIYYYLIYVYEEELGFIKQLKNAKNSDEDIKNFLQERETYGIPFKGDLGTLISETTKLSYSDAETEEVKSTSYIYNLEISLAACRKKLNTLLSATDTIYVNNGDYSYTFTVNSPFQWLLNASDFSNISDLIEKSEIIVKNTQAVENSQQNLNAYKSMASHYEESIKPEAEYVEPYAKSEKDNVEVLIGRKNALLDAAEKAKEEKQTWYDENNEKLEEKSKKDFDKPISQKSAELETKPQEQVNTATSYIDKYIKKYINPINNDITNINNYYNFVDGLKTLLSSLGDIDDNTYKSYCEQIDACLESINNAIAQKQEALNEKYLALIDKYKADGDEVGLLAAEIKYLEAQRKENSNVRRQAGEFIEAKEKEIEKLNDWIEIAKDINNEKNPVPLYKFILKSLSAKKDLSSLKLTTYKATATNNGIDYDSINNILTSVKDTTSFSNYNNNKSEINEKTDKINNLIGSVAVAYKAYEQVSDESDELNAEIEEATTFIAANYDKLSASLNDASFSYALYYRETANMVSPTEIKDQPELKYELLRGVVHTYGVDTKTISYLSYVVLFVGAALCLLFLIDTIVKAIRSAHDEQKFYLVGIKAFVKAAALFAGWTVFNIMINSLTFGSASLTIGGIILTAVCVLGLVINFIGGISSDAYFLNKKSIITLQLFAFVQTALLAVALVMFMLGGAMKPFVTAEGDIYAARKWIPVSVAWAVASMFIIIAGSIQLFKLIRILTFTSTKIGALSAKHKHVSMLFKCKSLISILTCFVILFIVLLLCMPSASALIQNMVISTILIAGALATRIIQNKVLQINSPKLTVGNWSNILTDIHTTPQIVEE